MRTYIYICVYIYIYFFVYVCNREGERYTHMYVYIKYCSPETNTSEVIADFQWHFPSGLRFVRTSDECMNVCMHGCMNV